jgi:hypothetical protein
MSERIYPNGWDPIKYLQGRHTKQLLGLRDELYKMNGGGRYIHPAQGTENQAAEEDYAILDVMGDHSGCVVTLAQIKAELATRPHVPNKAEAKVIRQERAKAGRNK